MHNVKSVQLHNFRLVSSLICILYLLIQLGSASAPTLAKVPVRNEFTYLALGDSLTAGIGASESNYLRLSAFVPQLTSHVREKHPVYVENHGIPGLTSSQLLTYLREGIGVKTKLAEADMITITIGGNDLLQLLHTEKSTGINHEELKQVLTSYRQNISEALAYIRGLNEDVPIYILDLYSPYGRDHPLQQISQEVVTSFNHELSQIVTGEEKTYLVSIYRFFLNQENRLTHIDNNDIHPNDQGYKIIFDAFRQNIVQ